MKNQFKQSRSAMLWSAVTKLLAVDLFGDIPASKYQRLEDILDEYLDIQDDREQFPEQMVAEVSYAIVSETVQKHDAETIVRMVALSKTKVLDVASDFLLEQAKEVTDTLVDTFPKDSTNQFIITNPLVISLLQSDKDTIFVPAMEGSFKGPNNTMLVGKIDDIAVYSYIPIDGGDTAVIGYSSEDSEKYDFVTYHIKLN